VKDQYVGDISDYEKYSVLRALKHAAALPLLVVWMLTDPDGRNDGRRIDYLGSPTRYRGFDPELFDMLSHLVHSGRRSVRAIEEIGLLGDAAFVSRRLSDDLESREIFFQEVAVATSFPPALVFFDPDIGIAGEAMRKGRKRSSMYVFEDEIATTFGSGNSVVLFQHFPRESRGPFLSRTLARLKKACGSPAAFALWSSRVAYIVLPDPGSADALLKTSTNLSRDWSPQLSLRSSA
jgi:hypothetical protein